MNITTLVRGAKKSALFGTALLAAPGFALAQTSGGADFSVIQDAVDWSAVATGILSILALGASVIVAFIGGKFLISAIKGSK